MICKSILDGMPTPAVRLNPDVPAELERIISKCLEKDRNLRYQHASEVRADLRRLKRDTDATRSTAVAGLDEWSDAPPGSSPASQSREIEASLFRRIFAFGGSSPYRMWEITHIRMSIWCLLLIYLGWRFRVATAGTWGLILFFSELLCATVLLLLFGCLLYAGAYDRSNFRREVRTMAPWIRALGVALGMLAFAMAGTIAASHTGLALLLAVMGTIMAATVLAFKPGIDRAAVSSFR